MEMKQLYLKPSTEVILSQLQLLAPQSMDIEVSEEDDRTIQTAHEYMWDDEFSETSWDEETSNEI